MAPPSSKISCHGCAASIRSRLAGRSFSSPRGSRPRKPRSPSTNCSLSTPTVRAATDRGGQAVLGRVAKSVDSMETTSIVSTVKATGSQPIRTAFRSPCQNGIAERWVGSVRRDPLDHVIVLNRKHLRRLLNEYVRYYHGDRTHLGLGSASPPSSCPTVISLSRLGELHHRYTVAA